MTTDFPVFISNTDANNRGRPTQYAQKPIEVRLTQEEIRLLRECNRESFYYRCVPFAIAGMAATYLAVQRGILKPHPKYGPSFKLLGAAFAGWVFGKFSYRSICEEKFLHLHNSPLADAIRKKRGLVVESNFPTDVSGTNESDLSFGQPLSSDQDYHSSFGSLNLDTDKNEKYSDFGDRLNTESELSTGSLESEEKSPKPSVTYEELRRRNREQNNRQHSPPPSPGSRWENYNSPVRRDTRSSEGSTAFNPNAGGIKNTYGDVWEK